MINDLLLLADSIGPCRLTRIEGGAALRTREVEGEALCYPKIGLPFFMRGAVLDQSVTELGETLGVSTGRLVNTSPLMDVLMLEDDKGFLLKTSSGSTYLLEVIRGSSNR